MKAINPNEIKDNFIELIGKEWMLVSAGDKEKFNMMTASWGGVGVLWNRPVVFAFIRPERYTREFIDARNEFTITFLGPEHRKAHSICGSKSGREIDKVAATGLTPLFTEAGNPVFEEARLTLECKVVYKQTQDTEAMTEENREKFYPQNVESSFSGANRDTHIAYYGEIVDAYVIE